MVIDRLSGGKGAFLQSDSRVSFSLIGHYTGEILARRKQGAHIGERPEKAARQTQQLIAKVKREEEEWDVREWWTMKEKGESEKEWDNQSERWFARVVVSAFLFYEEEWGPRAVKFKSWSGSGETSMHTHTHREVFLLADVTDVPDWKTILQWSFIMLHHLTLLQSLVMWGCMKKIILIAV